MVVLRPESRSPEVADCPHTVKSGCRLIVSLGIGGTSFEDEVVFMRVIAIEGFTYG